MKMKQNLDCVGNSFLCRNVLVWECTKLYIIRIYTKNYCHFFFWEEEREQKKKYITQRRITIRLKQRPFLTIIQATFSACELTIYFHEDEHQTIEI